MPMPPPGAGTAPTTFGIGQAPISSLVPSGAPPMPMPMPMMTTTAPPFAAPGAAVAVPAPGMGGGGANNPTVDIVLPDGIGADGVLFLRVVADPGSLTPDATFSLVEVIR
jgi:hypothetical protein